VAAAALAAGAGALVWLVGSDDLRDWGSHRKVRKVFHKLPKKDVTKVEIFLLMEQGTPTGIEFPVRPYKETVPVYGSLDLTGAELGEFLALWKDLVPANSLQAMCHYPAYGVRFFRDKTLLFEASLCWFCSNFWIEDDGWFGFWADHESGQALLAFLDRCLPYPRPNSPPDP
jgi:hypothetical protein